MKYIFILLLFAGCATYKVPKPTDNHPASTCISTIPIDLSPILDIEANCESSR